MSGPVDSAAYELPPEQSQDVFDTQIRPALTGTPRDGPGEQPVVIFIAGQPGAGKSSAQDAVLAQLGRQDAVPLDGDELLAQHPQHRPLALRDDRTVQLLLDRDADRWWHMAVDHIRQERLDVVISAPLGGAQWAGDRMAEFRAAGYRVEVVFVAIHEARSLLSIVDRYQGERDTGEFGRWVTPRAHDRSYPGVLDTADRVDAERLADAVYVVRRGGQVLHSNRFVNDAWEKPAATRQAIETERARPWTADELDHFRTRSAALADRIPDEIKPVLADAISRGLAHLRGGAAAPQPPGERAAQAYPVAASQATTSTAAAAGSPPASDAPPPRRPGLTSPGQDTPQSR